MEKRLASAEAALADRQGLIARADALRPAGFGEILAGSAQAEEKLATEVVPAFLDAAADWRRLAELRAQVAAADQQAQDAQRQAQARMADARLTERAVKAARWLLRQKVTIPTVEAWQAAAAKAGLTGHALATGLARALEQHGSLEAARQAWSAAVANLRVEHTKITAEVAALRHEREDLTAAIGAVRDAGIAEVRQVADAATAEVRRAAAEFEHLSTRAAELGQHVRMAEALASQDAAMWRRVEPETWAGLLAHLLRWAGARMVAAVEVEPPEPVKGRLEDQVRYSYSKGPVRLTLPESVGWLAVGLQGAPLRGVAALLAPVATANGARPRG